MKLSSTRLSRFLECKRKWWYNEVDERDVPPSKPMDWGSVFHGVVEFRAMYGAWPTIKTFESLEGNYEDPINAVERHGVELFEECKSVAKSAWSWADLDPEKLGVEVPVESFDLGVPASGWFDLLDRGQQRIIDWKTRSRLSYAPQSEADFRGDVQLCYYAAAARKALGWPDVEVVHLNVLRDGKTFDRATATLPGWYLDEVWEEIVEVIWPEMKRLAALDENDVERNPSVCFKYGGPCPHYDYCDSGEENNSSTGFFDALGDDMKVNSPQAPDDQEPIPFDNKPVSEIGLNTRATKNLKEAGYETFGDLDGVDSSSLESVPHVGPKTSDKIVETLEAYRG